MTMTIPSPRQLTRPLLIATSAMLCLLAVPTVTSADTGDRTANPADTALHTSITMSDAAISSGGAGQCTISLGFDDGWSASTAGIPNAIVQLDVPGCITLEGKVLTAQRDLARNEFLHAPFERMIEPGETTISFTVDEPPQDGDRIGVNIIAYMRHGEDEQAWFVRRRLELPLTPGATATAGNAADTAWGDDRSGMKIGDKVQQFALPRADGSKVDLAALIGKHNVIVTTYRAFW